MLDFYGMKLVNAKTGELALSDAYEDRFRNLNMYASLASPRSYYALDATCLIIGFTSGCAYAFVHARVIGHRIIISALRVFSNVLANWDMSILNFHFAILCCRRFEIPFSGVLAR
jgi:hypothetical protein